MMRTIELLVIKSFDVQAPIAKIALLSLEMKPTKKMRWTRPSLLEGEK